MMKDTTWKKINDWYKNFETSDQGIKYAWEVLYTEKYIVSNYVYKACQRHLMFFYHFINNPEEFPFVYDFKAVKIAYAFFKIQIIPESRKQYILADYRAFMLSVIIGWRFKDNPKRLITQEVFDIEARKNGKSTFYAIFNLYVLCGFLYDGLPQNYIIGAGEKSSKILYKLSANLINANPIMKKEFKKNNRDVIMSYVGGECVKTAFEKSAIEGQNPSLGILTEYHLHPDNRMQESLRTAINESRLNQLIIYDTTKGQNIDFPCFNLEKEFKFFLDEQIKNPNKVIDNYNIFLFCAELDYDKYSEWDNPKWWAQANPNLGITLKLENIVKQFKMLKSKMDLIDFKVKKIGMWLNQSDAYFEFGDIQKTQEKNENLYKEFFVNSEKYKDLNCILGLDLSNTQDTTALVATFEIPQEDNESVWIIKHLGFIPNHIANEKERIDKVPYFEWKEKGYLKFCNGSVIDYKFVTKNIKDFEMKYQVKKLAYDVWQFRFIKNFILDETFLNEDDLIPVKQGVNLTPSIREFERKLLLRKIYIADNNEMLISHILNIAMKPSKNINNNFYPEKVNFNSRIDGAIATFTALYERSNVYPEQKDSDLSAITI